MHKLITSNSFVRTATRHRVEAGDALLSAYEALEKAERQIAEQQKRLAELEDIARTDPLTGLMNRRGFETFFRQEQERLRRHDSKGCLLVLIDLDHFKDINDLLGHMAGDSCLKMVARHLENSIRLVDGAARLGGDEFALLLTQTDTDKAAARMMRVKQVLERMCLDWHGRRLQIGASFGFYAMDAESDFDTAYQLADDALYQNKNLRRNAEKPRRSDNTATPSPQLVMA